MVGFVNVRGVSWRRSFRLVYRFVVLSQTSGGTGLVVSVSFRTFFWSSEVFDFRFQCLSVSAFLIWFSVFSAILICDACYNVCHFCSEVLLLDVPRFQFLLECLVW